MATKIQTVQAEEKVYFYTSVEDGGFVYEIFPISIQDVLIKIDQIDSYMLLYSRQSRSEEKDVNNDNLFGFMLPMKVIENDNGEIVRVL